MQITATTPQPGSKWLPVLGFRPLVRMLAKTGLSRSVAAPVDEEKETKCEHPNCCDGVGDL